MISEVKPVPLGAILDVASGQVDPREEPYSTRPHVGGDNIERGTGRLFGLRPAHELNLVSGKYEFGPDDVLYSKIRPALNKVALPDFVGICSADMYPLRPRSGLLDRRYLAQLLRHDDFLSFAEKHSSRTSIPKINRDALLAYEVRLPSLPEQRRIAEILDKADSVRRKRHETITLAEALLRSAYLDMFADPVANPKGWPTMPMGSAIDRFEAGWSANGEARTRTCEEYGVLKVSAVTSGNFRPEEHKAVAATGVDRELVTPRRGDLLFSRANTRELVAACCLVTRDEPRLFLSDKLWRIVVNERVATPEYLKLLLGHSRFRVELTNRATGTSGSMLNLSMEKVRSMEMPIPPLAMQKRFSSLVWRIYALRDRLTSAREVSDNFFGALVQRSFGFEAPTPTLMPQIAPSAEGVGVP